MTHPSVAMLKEIQLLKSLTHEELDKLLEIGSTQTHEPHTNIVIEGENTWGLYIILEGQVGIYKSNRITGDIYDVGQLRGGQFFGEMSLIDDQPRSATVRTLTDTLLFYISKEAFSKFLEHQHDLPLRFFKNCTHDLISRLRSLGDDYMVSQYQLWRSVIKKESA